MTTTRFAITPSGVFTINDLHIALFSYLIAKHDNGKFYLRIEDTNQDNYDFNAESNIYKILKIFNLNYDDKPVIQSERINIYKQHVKYLLENDYAYYCFCDEKQLAKERLEATSKNETYMYDGRCRNLTKEEVNNKISNGEKYAIRQKVSKEGTTSFHDEVYGDITFENKYLEDQILLKSNETPTYNLSNVVDDGLMNITYVTRSNEHLSSTPKYIQLYDNFNFDMSKIIHFPMLVNEIKKISNISVIDLLNQGYLPEALLNYIALLGWSPKSKKEIFSLEELVEEFDYKHITKDSCYFDIEKLNWYNKDYLKRMVDEEYLKYIIPFIIRNCNMEGKDRDYVNKIALLYKEHIKNAMELVELIKIFFDNDIIYHEECRKYLKNSEQVKKIVLTFKNEIIKISDWNVTSITQCLNNVSEICNIPIKDIYMPIRISITGITQGPDIMETIYLIGKEKILNRLG